MAYTSTYNGIIFIEGEEPTAKLLNEIQYDKKFSYNSQLQTLDNIKDQFAKKAKIAGGNAVVHFTYGQKSQGWFKSILLALDDNVKWYGSGTVAIIPEERVKEICGQTNK